MQGASKRGGFTLIEMSIVLVIIGLIVGGILVGRDLVRAAEVRATVTQIEKYSQAVNTFRNKYGYLPGDIPATPASQFGFAARGTACGQGDGNGIIAGAHGCWGHIQWGETGMFWVDLSFAGLIEGSYTTANAVTQPTIDYSGTGLSLWFPQAKIGNGNYVYIWSAGSTIGGYSSIGINFFGISNISLMAGASNLGKISSTGNISVAQTYAIDAKIDDGQPQTGRVLAVFVNGDPVWSVPAGTTGIDTVVDTPTLGGVTGNVNPSKTTCYDNSNGTSATYQYSLEENGGSGQNCALSFMFQ